MEQGEQEQGEEEYIWEEEEGGEGQHIRGESLVIYIKQEEGRNHLL